MNSPARCRVRDLVSSCFNVCRLPLEEEGGLSGSKGQPKKSKKGCGCGCGSGSESKRRCSERNGVDQRSSHSFAEPRFSEEDYIVFCFGEDGEIHMINDTKSSDIRPKKKNETAYATSQSHPSTSTKGEEEEEEEEEIMNSSGVEQSKMESSFESCDSNLSDTSTTSFAFPILGKEWIGSPAHMPNPNTEDKRSILNCYIHTNF